METQIMTEPETKKEDFRKHKITPFLWFDNNAEEAVNFYTTIFNNAKINYVTHYGEAAAKAASRQKGSVMSIAFQLEGQEFVLLNGGPVFQITPTVSFFVNCKTIQEIDILWEKLSVNGTPMMQLDNYPFAEKYGWIQDKYGVSWQLILSDQKQKITPCFMFSGNQHKNAEKAINFYLSIFRDSELIQMEHYSSEQGPEGAVVHAKFRLEGQEFIAMDSHMALSDNFNPAISQVIYCETQDEIDYYWDKLSQDGAEYAQNCGWLEDKYGLSWQIVPMEWNVIMQDTDSEKSEKAMQAVLQMKKIDIQKIKLAII